MSDVIQDRSAQASQSPATGGDARRPWTAPVVVDRGSILEVVRANTGPSVDILGALMMMFLA